MTTGLVYLNPILSIVFGVLILLMPPYILGGKEGVQ